MTGLTDDLASTGSLDDPLAAPVLDPIRVVKGVGGSRSASRVRVRPRVRGCSGGGASDTMPRLDVHRKGVGTVPSRVRAGERRPHQLELWTTVPLSGLAVADGGELLGQAAAEGRYECEEA
jgi:hypothetical protein